MSDDKKTKGDPALEKLDNILLVLMEIAENTKVTDTGKPKVGVVVDETPVDPVTFEGFGSHVLTLANGKNEKVFFDGGKFTTTNPLIIKQLDATNFKRV